MAEFDPEFSKVLSESRWETDTLLQREPHWKWSRVYYGNRLIGYVFDENDLPLFSRKGKLDG